MTRFSVYKAKSLDEEQLGSTHSRYLYLSISLQLCPAALAALIVAFNAP